MLGPADCFKIASSPSKLIHALHVLYMSMFRMKRMMCPRKAHVDPSSVTAVLASTGYWHYNLKRDAAHSMDAASDADRTDL